MYPSYITNQPLYRLNRLLMAAASCRMPLSEEKAPRAAHMAAAWRAAKARAHLRQISIKAAAAAEKEEYGGISIKRAARKGIGK